MGRFISFGCSFTHYSWPTWSDFIGYGYDTYYNFGRPGAGNMYIASQVYEMNHRIGFKGDDTICVMFTSFSRNDFINNNSNWETHGNIFTNDFYNLDYLEKYWSYEHGIYMSWLAIESTIKLLDSIGCNYKLMSAFDVTIPEVIGEDEYKKMLEKSRGNHRVQMCTESIVQRLGDLNLWDFTQNKYMNKTWEQQNYKFEDFQHPDHHPSIEDHYQWVKNYMPDFYRGDMETQLNDWSKLMVNNKRLTSDNFRFLQKDSINLH